MSVRVFCMRVNEETSRRTGVRIGSKEGALYVWGQLDDLKQTSYFRSYPSSYPPEPDPNVKFEYSIRHIQSYAEHEAVGRLQQETWGEEFIDIVPPAILLVTQKVGGIVAGAFTPENELVAFVYGIPGQRNGVPIHWSHMLAVKKDWRGRGLGRELKRFQRDYVVSQGVRRMHWTYDPLEKLNASLNLVRLGALPAEYALDMYGDGESSTLYNIIGTDRFVVTWFLHDEDREAHISGFVRIDDVQTAPAVLSDDLAFISAKEGTPAVRIEIPESIQHIKSTNPKRARAWRTATRQAFTHYFEQGYGVVQFVEHPANGRFYYVMARPT